MKLFTTTLLAGSLLLASAAASANCVGSDSYKSCYDSSTGNSYTVHKIGDSTYVNGRNSQTGNSWSQSSQRIGDSTYTNGRDADGNSWNQNSQRIGNTTYTNGRDSDGNSYNGTVQRVGMVVQHIRRRVCQQCQDQCDQRPQPRHATARRCRRGHADQTAHGSNDEKTRTRHAQRQCKSMQTRKQKVREPHAIPEKTPAQRNLLFI